MKKQPVLILSELVLSLTPETPPNRKWAEGEGWGRRKTTRTDADALIQEGGMGGGMGKIEDRKGGGKGEREKRWEKGRGGGQIGGGGKEGREGAGENETLKQSKSVEFKSKRYRWIQQALRRKNHPKFLVSR